MSEPPPSSDRLKDVFVSHSDLLLKTDVLRYPSRKFKQGFDELALQPWTPFIHDVFCVGPKLLQHDGEVAYELWDKDCKGGLKLAAQKKKMDWLIYRKQNVFVFRVLMAHVMMKKKQYEKALKAGSTPRTHPEWLVELYKVAEQQHEWGEARGACEGRSDK